MAEMSNLIDETVAMVIFGCCGYTFQGSAVLPTKKFVAAVGYKSGLFAQLLKVK